MERENIRDLLAFLAVARARSFTRAAAKLGVSPSALSHTIRGLETSLGMRLLTRTTRSVLPTSAGSRILERVGPHFEEIEDEIQALKELQDTPSGLIRITTMDHPLSSVLWPRMWNAIAAYPDIKVEVHVDYGLSDIVADGYDIGVRWGDQVAKDMIAVRVAPDTRMAIVGAPSYFAQRSLPKTPKDLLGHDCITLRLQTSGGLYAWELQKGKREIQVRVGGRFTFNGVYPMRDAALSGAGLAFLPEDFVQPHVASGHLRWVMQDWSPTFPGLHIYYASRKETSRALAVVVDALRLEQ